LGAFRSILVKGSPHPVFPLILCPEQLALIDHPVPAVDGILHAARIQRVIHLVMDGALNERPGGEHYVKDHACLVFRSACKNRHAQILSVNQAFTISTAGVTEKPPAAFPTNRLRTIN
jgi:hypothetical protein